MNNQTRTTRNKIVFVVLFGLTAAIVLILALRLFEQDATELDVPLRRSNGGEQSPTFEQHATVEPDSSVPADRILLAPLTEQNTHRTRVAGGVFDPDGVPRPGLIIAFERRPEPESPGILEGAVKSDDAGRYALNLTPGPYTVQVSVPSPKLSSTMLFVPQDLEIPETRQFPLDLHAIRPLCQIWGTVNRSDNTPLEGVGVALCTPSLNHLERTSTAGDGTFFFTPVAPGSYRLFFDRGPLARKLLFPWKRSHAPERSPDRWPKLVVGPGDRELDYHLTLAAPVELRGSVSTSWSNFASGALVFLQEIVTEQDGRTLGSRRFYSSPVRNGELFYNAVYPAEYSAYLYGVPDGQARPSPQRIAVDPFMPGQYIAFVFEAPGGGCRLDGQVLDQDGNGLAGARVVLWDDAGLPIDPARIAVYARAEALCDGEGRFSIIGLSPGRYRLRRDRRPLSNDAPVILDEAEDYCLTVGEGENRALLRVEGFERVTLKVTVPDLDTSIKLKAKVKIAARDGFDAFTTWGLKGRDGVFTINAVPRVPFPVWVEVVADMEKDREIVCAGGEVDLTSSREAVIPVELSRRM